MVIATAVAIGQAKTETRSCEAVESLRSGSVVHWERLLGRMERRCLSLAWRILNDSHLAADAVQEGYLKAYSGRATLHASSDVERWLLAIVANAARDMARSKSRASEPVSQVPDDLAAPLNLAAASDVEEQLHAALAKLDEPARIIFLLVHQEGFSYEAVAREFGWPIGTVRSTLHRARRRLKGLMGVNDEDTVRPQA